VNKELTYSTTFTKNYIEVFVGKSFPFGRLGITPSLGLKHVPGSNPTLRGKVVMSLPYEKARLDLLTEFGGITGPFYKAEVTYSAPDNIYIGLVRGTQLRAIKFSYGVMSCCTPYLQFGKDHGKETVAAGISIMF
jgi:hypothetical protein